MAKNALSRWRTTNVAHTDKQDFDHLITIRSTKLTPETFCTSEQFITN
jgi:hypothetical protein